MQKGFAGKLGEMREGAGFPTTYALSLHMEREGFGVSYDELRRYERGEHLPSLPAFVAIAKALRLNQRQIVGLLGSVAPAKRRSKSRRRKSSSVAGSEPVPPRARPAKAKK